MTTAHRFSESSATPPLSQTREPTQMSNAEHQELTSAFELEQASPERLTADLMQAQPPKRERYDYQKSRTQQPGTSDAHKMTPVATKAPVIFLMRTVSMPQQWMKRLPNLSAYLI
nr:hypothetical protein [Psychrobacter sp. PraFG1]UNK05215.1 hypothetical protein MN210_14890 [Psychrobacter sp. PraFG1]